MKSNSPITFSVEKGFRFFDNGVSFFHYFMIQFEVPKTYINSKTYYFSLTDEQNNELYSKNIIIDLVNKRIITPNSHEDPLVEDSNNFYICFQIDSEILSTINKPCVASFLEESINNSLPQNKNMTPIASYHLPSLSIIYEKYNTEHYSSIIDSTKIMSKKDCALTLHLGDSDGIYSEQYFSLEKNSFFDFKEYIQKYEYIGVQCSYENEKPEIEEKHIIVGQKGIFLSGVLYNEDNKIMPPMPFITKYQKHYIIDDFILVNSIDELISYYKKNNLKPRYFESNLYFLLPSYTKSLTYNQDKLYSIKELNKKNHFLSDVCKNCIKNFKCLQAIPSGLSSELFKINIMLENNSDCPIFKLLD